METIIRHRLIEKRAATRYPVVLFVVFEHGQGWTRDVSTTGVCIETDQPFACGDNIRFFMNQPDPQGWGTTMQCSGLVVRVEQAGDVWRLGVVMQAFKFGIPLS